MSKEKENKVKENLEKIESKKEKRKFLKGKFRIATVTNIKVYRFLWLLLTVAFLFAVFKSFTAIDRHTIHEREVINQKVYSSNKIENFITDFAGVFYSWDTDSNNRALRVKNLENYMQKDIAQLNSDVFSQTSPSISKFVSIRIYDVYSKDDNTYTVLYTVRQNILNGAITTNLSSTFSVDVYLDKNGDMLIVSSPRPDVEPKRISGDISLKDENSDFDSKKSGEIKEFLETFFKAYPKADDKELKIYSSSANLKVINKDYVFSEISDLKITVDEKDEDVINACFNVKYIDTLTSSYIISGYDIVLKKDKVWKIIK